MVLPSELTSAASHLPAQVAGMRTRLQAMSGRLVTVEQLIALDPESAARRVRAAVAELERIVDALPGATSAALDDRRSWA